jgi:hypothetical protein
MLDRHALLYRDGHHHAPRQHHVLAASQPSLPKPRENG